MSDEWFFLPDDSDEKQGPFTVAQLKQKYNKKEIHAKTYVWNVDLPAWKEVDDLGDLKRQLTAAPIAPSRAAKAAPKVPPKKSGESKTSSKTAAVSRAGGSNRRSRPKVVQNSHKQFAEGWSERATVDGMPYYYNSLNDNVSWEKPDELKTEEEKKIDSGNWVWVRDKKEAWLPAQLLDDGTVKLQNGQKVNMKQSKDEPMWPLKQSALTRLSDDLVMLDDPNEAAIVYNLRERFRENKIYTWVGASKSVLVSVNPFKMLPLYGPDIIQDYMHPGPMRGREPHVFSIANSSFRSMQLNENNHAILISGESGAGKTEATKQVLSFLADAAVSEDNIEQRILMANPVLEAYGNAKTLRNNNSSRFGKWIEVHFDRLGRVITSASIENFLLEKSRVVQQQKDERNYHIFYQLCEAGPPSLNLDEASSYRYLSGGSCIKVEGMDDAAEFTDVQQAMKHLGFTADEKSFMYDVTAGVLTLGNADFSSKSGKGNTTESDVSNPAMVARAAEFLQVEPSALSTCLTSRSIEVRGERSVIGLAPNDARDGTDALSKCIYGKLFDWLVLRVNEAIAGERGAFIGVLDIFGFEIFENNSFEQLCINFCNEKLQQHFNQHTFKEEEELYRTEGIEYTAVKFIDNQPVLNLIEKSPKGILVMLDEEIVAPNGSDERFLSKIMQIHEKDPGFKTDRLRARDSTAFAVIHYAGEVNYDAKGFLSKNKDILFPDMTELMLKSKNDKLKDLFVDKTPAKTSGFRGKKQKSLGGQFRKQLNKLMKLLYDCEPWYVRCVKSNHLKKANKFENQMCLDQLRYSGVFEAVKIRKTGFPFRFTHQSFVSRFRPISLNDQFVSSLKSGGKGDDIAICREILAMEKIQKQNFKDVQIGRTMVMYRAHEHHVLELLRHIALEKIVPLAQRVSRGATARRFYQILLQCGVVISTAMASARAGMADVTVLEKAIDKCAVLVGPMRGMYSTEHPMMKEIKTMRFAMKEWTKLTEVYRQLSESDVTQMIAEFTDAVQRGKKILDVPHTEEQDMLYKQCDDMLENCVSLKLDPLADEALYTLDEAKMRDVLAEAQASFYTSSDLQEIERVLALPEADLTKMQLKKAIELNDPQRVIHREVALKMMFLRQNHRQFEFSRFGRMRDPVEYACAKFMSFMKNKTKIAEGMLKFDSKPIHISLIEMEDPKESKLAVKMFKNVLGYMGDRKYANPPQLATDILTQCLNGTEEIRLEIFCQIMKQ